MKTDRLSNIRYVALCLFLAVIAGWGFYFLGLEAFLRSAYDGESLSYFNEYAARWRGRTPNPSYETFFREAQTLLFRFGVLGTISAFIPLFLYYLKPKPFLSFFSVKTSPFNLALFRIAVFGVLLSFSLEKVHWYARLPDILQVPPPGLSSIVPLLSTDPTFVYVLATVFQIACIFGLVGLYTPVASAVALVTGLYVLGIPQFYGKIGHFHYVFWCAALLIFSRPADVLSLDVLRRQSSGFTPPQSARVYALPIRYAWLLLGVVYFFPGFWKFASEGFAWALSENVKYNMHMNWFLRSFEPVFRLDKYPALYQGAGLFTLLFEVGFVFVLPFRALHSWVLVVALVFHEANRIFLGVFFAVLYPFLPFLVNVRAAIVHMGEWLYPNRLVLTYDGKQSWQCYVAETLLRMDLLHRLEVREYREENTGTTQNEPHLSVSSSDSESRALWIDGRFQWRQFLSLSSYVPAAIPLFPLAPLMKKGGVTQPDARPSKRDGTFAVSLIGGFLIAANVICGFAKINSYPFSVYPTFAVRADSTVTTLRVEGVDQTGASMTVLSGSQDHEQAGFGQGRFRGLIRSILRVKDDSRRTEKLQALWSVIRKQRSEFRSIMSLRFYEATYSTNPDRTSDPLLGRSLITTLDVSPSSGSGSD